MTGRFYRAAGAQRKRDKLKPRKSDKERKTEEQTGKKKDFSLITSQTVAVLSIAVGFFTVVIDGCLPGLILLTQVNTDGWREDTKAVFFSLTPRNRASLLQISNAFTFVHI